MKKHKLNIGLIILLSCGFVSMALSQTDDLYYDPDKDSEYYYSSPYDNNSLEYNDNEEYDDDEYEYFDEYDYEYTSRIRRFHRPYYGFDFFDPCYVDLYYYDPFFFPFTTVLIYDSYYPWRYYRRWSRWNWGFGYNSWRGSYFVFSYNFGSPWYNPWYSPWYGNTYYVNNYYYGGFDPYYGYGNYYGVGTFSNVYCPPTWGNGYTYNTANDNYYFGSRRIGTSGTRPNNGPGLRPSGNDDPQVVSPVRDGASVRPRETTGIGQNDDAKFSQPSDNNPKGDSRSVESFRNQRNEVGNDNSPQAPRTKPQSDILENRNRTKIPSVQEREVPRVNSRSSKRNHSGIDSSPNPSSSRSGMEINRSSIRRNSEGLTPGSNDSSLRLRSLDRSNSSSRSNSNGSWNRNSDSSPRSSGSIRSSEGSSRSSSKGSSSSSRRGGW